MTPGSARRVCLTATAVLVAAFAAGCGRPQSPEHVVRDWSKAFNAGDSDAAADLFAANAKVIAGDSVRVLQDHDQAVAFNAALPFCGRIVKLTTVDTDVTVRFALAERSTQQCGSGGEHASIFFRVRDGKIVLFNQIGA
jgi:hypothetical protein